MSEKFTSGNLPILALRGLVIYPEQTMHFDVGRMKSVLALEAAMKCLNERERYIIKLRFFEGKTQMEVAQEIDISQAQVSRLEKHALKMMRNYLR